jgi:uncharacterized protein (DUF1015 family)
VPRFEPFPGVRYDPARVALDDVVAPPYDVIGPEEREILGERSPYNVVHVDLAHDEGGRSRYETARCRFDEWIDAGVLAVEPEPCFYVYRMGFHDDDGVARQTTGVVGALELAVPGEGGILPHERTMSRPKGDRLELLRACRANLSPIWGLSLAADLSALCEVSGPPLARCTDDDGVHHRLWRLARPAAVAAVAETVASAPVVIADGHHRYETALAWQQEVRAATGGRSGDHDLVLAYVVELAADQLSVGPIHRMVSGLPADFDPVAALAAAVELRDAGPPGPDLEGRMAAAGAFAVVTAEGAWLGTAGPTAATTGAGEPDAALLDGILATWPPHTIEYTHRTDEVVAAVEKGDAGLGLVLRPATVEQISHTAHAGRRMPPKTTFFRPKPRTGMVFRRLAEPAPPAGPPAPTTAG